MQEKELAYWITFDRMKGVGLGPRRTERLYAHFGSLEEAWCSSVSDLREVKGLPESSIEKFIRVRSQYSIQKSLDLVGKHNVTAITIASDRYPSSCIDLPNPPLILYIKGKWDLDWYKKSIGVVGTRKATAYGLELTHNISARLASEGFTIITGVAKGIDTAAHEGSIAIPGHRSVAVVANGVDQVVPASNRHLYEILEREGAIISEHPPETQPERGFFPMRNRIIAALSQATLVAEAGEKSGALITAECARDMNKPVFCFAGHINNKSNKGGHYWLRKGYAKLVTSHLDILEELEIDSEVMGDIDPIESPSLISSSSSFEIPKQSKPKPSIDLSTLKDEERQIIELLVNTKKMNVDQLIEKTGLGISKMNSLLMKLNLKQLIIQDGAEIFLK